MLVLAGQEYCDMKKRERRRKLGAGFSWGMSIVT